MLNTISSNLSLQNMSVFSLPLPEAVCESAAIESQDYPLDSLKAEQVYLSHLADYAARYYFGLCGYAVSERSRSTLDFLDRALSDSTTITVLGYGSFACLVVSIGASALAIPASALAAPVGYMVVEFDDELAEATVVGFLPQTQEVSVAVAQLRSLTELPDYLNRLNPLASAATQLNRWWDRSVDQGWTLVSEIAADIASEPTLAFRSRRSESAVGEPEVPAEALPDDGLICRKTLSLSSTEATFSLTLMMERFAQADRNVNILAKLSPDLGQAYLPADVQLMAADDSFSPFSSMRSRDQSPFIELKFRASPGDYFRLTVAFEGVAVAEDFII